MKAISVPTLYYSQTGPENTTRTLELAGRRAADLGIQSVLVATTRGQTGELAAKIWTGFDIIAVTHATGFLEPDHQELTPENRVVMEAAGVHILTCQHALGEVNRAVRRKFDTYQIDEIIAHTLRLFSQGVKVCVEMALMAADAGLVHTDTPLMTVAGTGRGADTAVVLLPAHAQDFFDLRILEIVCCPSPEHPGFTQSNR